VIRHGSPATTLAVTVRRGAMTAALSPTESSHRSAKIAVVEDGASSDPEFGLSHFGIAIEWCALYIAGILVLEVLRPWLEVSGLLGGFPIWLAYGDGGVIPPHGRGRG
jgi:hypothetical protein